MSEETVWLARFITELDDKQREIEIQSLCNSSKESRALGMLVAGIFEGIKKCAIRASSNTTPISGEKDKP